MGEELTLSWCLYCGYPARNGVCPTHSDLPALDPNFASLRARLIAEQEKSTVLQGKRLDFSTPGPVKCS